jgi:nitroreductase
MIKDLVRKTRSYRRFYQDVPVDQKTLRELVDLGRLSASGQNRQPLKYKLCCDPTQNALVFAQLGWARLLPDWPGPAEGERPAAYIIILGDKEIHQEFGLDPGISAQSIILGATEKGLGGCMLRNIRRDALRQALSIPERYEIVMVLALGKPKEKVVLDPVGPDGDIKYWRDAQQVHHVPKRSLDEVIVG